MSSTPRHKERQTRQLHKHSINTSSSKQLQQQQYKTPIHNNNNNNQSRLLSTPVAISQQSGSKQTPIHNNTNNQSTTTTTEDYTQLPYKALSDTLLPYSIQPDVNNPQYVQHFIQSIIDKKYNALSNIQSKLSYRTIQLDNKNEQSLFNNKKRKAYNSTVEQRASKQLKTLSNKQSKQLGLYDIKKQKHNYQQYIALHDLWLQYINDVFNINKHQQQQASQNNKQNEQHNNSNTDTSSNKQQKQQQSINKKSIRIDDNKLLGIDLIGSKLTCIQSHNPCQVNISGIVIYETQYVFYIVTDKNKLKILSKKDNVFQLNICNYTYNLYGNQFMYRSIERSVRKWKHKPTIEM